MAEKKGSSSEKTLYCSFCGKSQHEVKKLIAGPSVFVCDECIDLCNEIIRDELPAGDESKEARSDLPTPAEIKATLDGYVIGQEPAKRTLAVADTRYEARQRISQERRAYVPTRSFGGGPGRWASTEQDDYDTIPNLVSCSASFDGDADLEIHGRGHKGAAGHRVCVIGGDLSHTHLRSWGRGNDAG